MLKLRKITFCYLSAILFLYIFLIITSNNTVNSARMSLQSVRVQSREPDRLRAFAISQRYGLPLVAADKSGLTWTDHETIGFEEGLLRLSHVESLIVSNVNGRDAGLLFSAFIVLGLTLLRSKISIWWITAGAACLASGSLVFDCLGCSQGQGTSAIVPYAAFGLTLLMVAGMSVATRSVRLAILLWSVLAVAFGLQIGLLVQDPKFCPACITIGFAIITGLAELGRGVSDGEWVGLKPSRYAMTVVALLSVWLAGRNIAYANGLLQDGSASRRDGNVTHAQLLASLRNVSVPLGTGVIVLTSPGCGACETMKDDLRVSSLPKMIVEPCRTGSLTPCWDTAKLRTVTPTYLLRRNFTPLIIQSGWPADPQSATLLVKELERASGTSGK